MGMYGENCGGLGGCEGGKGGGGEVLDGENGGRSEGMWKWVACLGGEVEVKERRTFLSSVPR